MPTPRYILDELARREYLKGRILIYGTKDKNDGWFWCSDTFDPLHWPKMPSGEFDTIICTFVLNMLTPKQRRFVIRDILSRLTVEGRVYFTVTPGSMLPFKRVVSDKDYVIYHADYGSLTNWNKVYEARLIIDGLKTYIDRADVVWKEYSLHGNPVGTFIGENTQVMLWPDGGHQPDDEKITRIKFAKSVKFPDRDATFMSADIIASGDIYQAAYEMATPVTLCPFPVPQSDTFTMTLQDCRKLIEAAVKDIHELCWSENY